MNIKFDLTDDYFNTKFAPIGALLAYYQHQKVLEPLELVVPAIKKRKFSLPNQLTQLFLSILSGCEYISVINTRLRPEYSLAQVYRNNQFADSSTLSKSLDQLSLTNLGQLTQAVRKITHRCSRASGHDWRGFLKLDFDLSGLPCGKQAEKSEKGYFSGKKMLLVAN
jgi:hypothetical protein